MIRFSSLVVLLIFGSSLSGQNCFIKVKDSCFNKELFRNLEAETIKNFGEEAALETFVNNQQIMQYTLDQGVFENRYFLINYNKDLKNLYEKHKFPNKYLNDFIESRKPLIEDDLKIQILILNKSEFDEKRLKKIYKSIDKNKISFSEAIENYSINKDYKDAKWINLFELPYFVEDLVAKSNIGINKFDVDDIIYLIKVVEKRKSFGALFLTKVTFSNKEMAENRLTKLKDVNFRNKEKLKKIINNNTVRINNIGPIYKNYKEDFYNLIKDVKINNISGVYKDLDIDKEHNIYYLRNKEKISRNNILYFLKSNPDHSTVLDNRLIDEYIVNKFIEKNFENMESITRSLLNNKPLGIDSSSVILNTPINKITAKDFIEYFPNDGKEISLDMINGLETSLINELCQEYYIYTMTKNKETAPEFYHLLSEHLVEFFNKEIVNKSISNQEIKNFYNSNKAKFIKPKRAETILLILMKNLVL